MNLAQAMKRALRQGIRSAGYELTRIDNLGIDPFFDMKQFTPSSRPLVIDVGANVGQSVQQFRKTFPTADIHCFEPCRATYLELVHNVRRDKRVECWNVGLGSESGTRVFFEAEKSDYSSFLALRPDTPVGTSGRCTLELHTLDGFCNSHRIGQIDVLKSDTQGYELEVLKGSEHLLRSGRVRLVYLEINFSRLYEGQASAAELFEFLENAGFRFVSFYQIHRRNEQVASWADALFAYTQSRCPSRAADRSGSEVTSRI